MKTSLYVGLWLAICGAAHSASASTLSSLSSAQKVLVWAQVKDPGIEQAMEFEMQARLADRQIMSERYSKVFPRSSAMASAAALATMRELSMDALVVLQPLGNIHWPKDSASPGSALERFLATPSGGLRPVAVAPQSTLITQPVEVSVPARGPIAGNQGPDAEQVIKVGAIIFDVSTGELLWKGRLSVRAPADLPTLDHQKRVADNAVDALSKAGWLLARQ